MFTADYRRVSLLRVAESGTRNASKAHYPDKNKMVILRVPRRTRVNIYE